MTAFGLSSQLFAQNVVFSGKAQVTAKVSEDKLVLVTSGKAAEALYVAIRAKSSARDCGDQFLVYNQSMACYQHKSKDRKSALYECEQVIDLKTGLFLPGDKLFICPDHTIIGVTSGLGKEVEISTDGFDCEFTFDDFLSDFTSPDADAFASFSISGESTSKIGLCE